MNIYNKLGSARAAFHRLDLTKTGQNKFAGYKYFELGDFLIPAMDCLAEEGLIPVISFSKELATLTVYPIDGEGEITITSPMEEANLKGCHPIQNLGAVETYQRRYLWVTLMEIVEHDALDSSEPVKAKPKRPAQPLADEAQKLSIQDWIDAGKIDDKQKAWLKKHWNTLTKTDAASILTKLKEKENEGS